MAEFQITNEGLIIEDYSLLLISFEHAHKIGRAIKNKCKVCYLTDEETDDCKEYFHALITDEKIRLYHVVQIKFEEHLSFVECTIADFLNVLKQLK